MAGLWAGRFLGLDQPEVIQTNAGLTVRTERQLTCPAVVAWDLWFGMDRDTGEQRNAPAERDAAAQMWACGAIGHLAACAAAWPMAQAVDT